MFERAANIGNIWSEKSAEVVVPVTNGEGPNRRREWSQRVCECRAAANLWGRSVSLRRAESQRERIGAEPRKVPVGVET
jgi:hypothetical protein